MMEGQAQHFMMLPELLQQIEQCARLALVEEVLTTPKPGLVDLHDRGAHRDMDWKLFVKSADAISPYLGKMCVIGYNWELSLPHLFKSIRAIGTQAECAMLKQTGGVNTHKGAIFTMGILMAAVGYSLRKNGKVDTACIFRYAKEMTAEAVEQDFAEMKERQKRLVRTKEAGRQTAGEYLYLNMGIEGIRGEAREGFPIIRKVAYPLMKQYIAEGMAQNERNINVLLAVMEELTDTNILSRSGYDLRVLEQVKRTAGEIRKLGGASTETGMEALRSWNLSCIHENLSPGGAADILSATVFLIRVEKVLKED